MVSLARHAIAIVPSFIVAATDRCGAAVSAAVDAIAASMKAPRTASYEKPSRFGSVLGKKEVACCLQFPPKPEGMHPTAYGRIRENAMKFVREILNEDLAALHGVSIQAIEANVALPRREKPTATIRSYFAFADGRQMAVIRKKRK